MATFRSAITGYQTFTKKGTKVRFIGGRLETENQEIIDFLRRGIQEKRFDYNGRKNFVLEVGADKPDASALPPPEPAKDPEPADPSDDRGKSKRELTTEKLVPPYARKKGDTPSSK